MNTLLELTWRGALMLVVVASLDRLCTAKIGARVRRAWWLLVPLAFLVTVPLPVLPAIKSAASQSVGSPGTLALSVEVATRLVGQASTNAPMQWPHAPWALVIALGGSAIYSLNVLARTCAALRRFKGLPLCTDPALLLVLEECQARVGVVSRVGLVVSEGVPAPLVLGWLRPRILLPSALVTSLSREQLRGVLFHELTHVRAQDVPCTFLFTLVCALHWFNPAAHLALRWWAQFREEAADEAAIVCLGASSNLTYGETLLCVLRAANGPRQTSLAVLAVVDSVGQLRKRLLMIKQHPSKSSHRILATAVFVVAAAVLLRPVHATVPADVPTASPSSDEATPLIIKPSAKRGYMAIQVAGTTVAVLPGVAAGGTKVSGPSMVMKLAEKGTTEWKSNVTAVEGTSATRNPLNTMIFKGEVTTQITVPDHPPVTITGNDLTFVGQDPASPEIVTMLGNPNPSTSTGKFDAAGNPILPPPVSWELQCGGVPVAVVPVGATKGDVMSVDATTGAAYNSKTHMATFSGKVTLTLTVPGQPPITVTSEDLTLIPRW